MPLKTIIVGSTLSDLSEPVAEVGAAIARAGGASLVLAHGFEVPLHVYYGGSYEVAAVDPTLYEATELEHRQALTDQLARVAGDLSAASCELRVGGGAGVVLELAAGRGADLIVVGASERGRVEEQFLGSTPDRVLRGATVPVFVAREPVKFPPANILAPVDLSQASLDAFHGGLDVLAAFAGPHATVTALFVLVPPPGSSGVPFSHEQLREFAEAALQRLASEAESRHPIRVLTMIRDGRPQDEIHRATVELAPDLVLLGTHGRGGFRRFLLGSVASDVTRRAGMSCLIVPPAAAGAAAAAGDARVQQGPDWTYLPDDVAGK